MDQLKWVPIGGHNRSDDDKDTTPSGKETGPDDVGMALIFLVLWMAVHQSNRDTLRLFNPLSEPIGYPTRQISDIVEDQKRVVFPSANRIL